MYVYIQVYTYVYIAVSIFLSLWGRAFIRHYGRFRFARDGCTVRGSDVWRHHADKGGEKRDRRRQRGSALSLLSCLRHLSPLCISIYRVRLSVFHLSTITSGFVSSLLHGHLSLFVSSFLPPLLTSLDLLCLPSFLLISRSVHIFIEEGKFFLSVSLLASVCRHTTRSIRSSVCTPHLDCFSNMHTFVHLLGFLSSYGCWHVHPSVREEVKKQSVKYDKTEEDLKALQGVGQLIGEVLRQLDSEKCESDSSLFNRAGKQARERDRDIYIDVIHPMKRDTSLDLFIEHSSSFILSYS